MKIINSEDGVLTEESDVVLLMELNYNVLLILITMFIIKNIFLLEFLVQMVNL